MLARGRLGVTDNQVALRLCQIVERELRKENFLLSVEKDFRGLSGSDLLIEFLSSIGSVLGDRKCLLVLDEIDSILPKKFAPQLLDAIRQIYNARALRPGVRSIIICLVGVLNRLELARRGKFIIGKIVWLNDFKAGHSLVGSISPYVNSVSGDNMPVTRRIFYWTDGHPLLTMMLCSELLDQSMEQSSEFDLRIEDLVKNSRSSASDPRIAVIVDEIDRFFRSRSALKEKALLRYSEILKGIKILDQEDIVTLTLKLSGIVKRNEQGHLVVRNRIFSRMFDEEWLVALSRARRPRKITSQVVVDF